MEKQAYFCYTCGWSGVDVRFDSNTNMLHCTRCALPTLVMSYQGGIISNHPCASDLPLSKPLPPHTPAGNIKKVHPRARAVAHEQAQLIIHEALRLMGYFVRHKLDGATYVFDAVEALQKAATYATQRELPVEQRDELVAYMTDRAGDTAYRMLFIAGVETAQERAHRLFTNPRFGELLKTFAGLRRPTAEDMEAAKKEEEIYRLAVALNVPFREIVFKFGNLADKWTVPEIEYIKDAVCRGDVDISDVRGNDKAKLLTLSANSFFKSQLPK